MSFCGNSPLISVIVPIYNQGKYIRRCIDSIIKQTYKNLDIILIDDGSSDSSGIICDEYVEIDKRIRCIHKENGGQASARNIGLEVAKGEIVGFVDSDDWINENMYENMVEAMYMYNVDYVCCNSFYVYEDSQRPWAITSEDYLIFDKELALRLLLDNKIVTETCWSKIYKAKVWDNQRFIEGMAYEDVEIMHRIINNAERGAFINKNLYYYYMSPKSTTRGIPSEKIFDRVLANEKRVEFYDAYFPKLKGLSEKTYVDVCVNVVTQTIGYKNLRNKKKQIIRRMYDVVKSSRTIEKSFLIQFLITFAYGGYYLFTLGVYCVACWKKIRNARRRL